MENNAALGQEWTVLQNLHERYEFVTLAVKLLAVLLFFVAAMLELALELTAPVLLVLWLQEAIYKTFQARLGERLLQLEQALAAADATGVPAFQLHTRWLAGRKGMGALLGEYLRSALRPTVAFPYAALLLMALLLTQA